MSDLLTAHIIAVIVIIGFFALVTVVLLGFVDVTDPTRSKLVGMLFGYVTAMLNPIIYRYFGNRQPPTD